MSPTYFLGLWLARESRNGLNLRQTYERSMTKPQRESRTIDNRIAALSDNCTDQSRKKWHCGRQLTLEVSMSSYQHSLSQQWETKNCFDNGAIAFTFDNEPLTVWRSKFFQLAARTFFMRGEQKPAERRKRKKLQLPKSNAGWAHKRKCGRFINHTTMATLALLLSRRWLFFILLNRRFPTSNRT